MFRRPVFWGAVTLVAAAAFLGCDIAGRQIVLWDESRVVANALEMSRTGFSLITTYDFKPDLWNTKPPLAIWLIAACIRLFGPSEWAARVPTLLAAIATVALVMGFTWRLTRNRLTTFVATVLLVFSAGFYGVHAGQSADYDILLTLFVTGYGLLLFQAIHHARPKAWLVLLCGLLVACACLTKGVAGLIPGVGVALYVLISGRLSRLFRTPWYALAAVVAAAPVAAFYLAREHASAGYLQSVVVSELTGRYLHGIKSHFQPPTYYLSVILTMFAVGPALVLFVVAPVLRWRNTRSRAFLVYGACFVVTMVLVLSLSQTKIFWYVAPIYPVLSIMMAILVEQLLRVQARRWPGAIRSTRVMMALVAVVLAGLAIYNKRVVLPRVEDTPQGRYGLVFDQLQTAGLHRVRTLDGGVDNDEAMIGYTPQLHIYTLVWQARGMAIGSMSSLGALQPGEVAVTCDARFTRRVRALGPSLTRVPDCAAALSPKS